MASRDKGLHPSPPVPSASPPRLQGTTDMGRLGISSFRDMPASLFVSSACPALLLLAALRCPRTHTHTHTLTRAVPDRTGQLIKTSSLPYLGTFCVQGPLHISPKFNHPHRRPHWWHTRTAAHPITSQPLDAGLLFTEKTLSLIYSLVRTQIKPGDPGPSPERNKPHRLLHRHVPGGARLPT